MKLIGDEHISPRIVKEVNDIAITKAAFTLEAADAIENAKADLLGLLEYIAYLEGADNTVASEPVNVLL